MGNYDDVIGWFSLPGGLHVPLRKGESKADAAKRALAERANRESNKKSNDIVKSQEQAKRLNDESKRRDAVTKGAKCSIQNGKLTFNGKSVDALNTSRVGTPGKDSFADHFKNGTLTPERLETHRQIMEEYFKGHTPYAPGEQKVAMFTGGGGASGKGQFTKVDDATGERNVGKFYSQDKNPLVVDPDRIKHMLAEADGKKLDDKLTSYYHTESSALAGQIYATSLQNNYPTLYDGTATKVPAAIEKCDMAEKYGYKTEMCFITSNWRTIRENSLYRYEKENRLVPLPILTDAHRKSYDAISQLQDKFDSFKLYDNAGRKMKLVGESRDKKPMKIVDKEVWDRISKSGKEFMLSKYQIKNYDKAVQEINAKRKK